MSPLTAEQITLNALTLPENERTRLTRVLLQSLETLTDIGVEDAWNNEVSRRVEAVHRGAANGRPAEDVSRDIRSRFEK